MKKYIIYKAAEIIKAISAPREKQIKIPKKEHESNKIKSILINLDRVSFWIKNTKKGSLNNIENAVTFTLAANPA